MENNTRQTNREETAQKTKTRAWVMFVLALLIFYFMPILGAAFLLLGPSLTPANPLLGTGLGELVFGLLAVLAMLLLGGKKWLRFSAKGLRFAFRLSWPLLAADAALVVWSVIRMLQTGVGVGNVFPALLGAFVFCLGIGLFEETDFRGLLLNGLLAPLGKSRTWVLLCVIASSLWFGKVHVGKIDASDTAAFLLAALKILQAGCFGVIMCALVLRTRELGGAFLIHMLHDFMLMSMSVLSGRQATGSYTDSSSGAAVFIAYGLLLAVILLPTIWAFRSILRGGDEDHGAFMLPNESKAS